MNKTHCTQQHKDSCPQLLFTSQEAKRFAPSAQVSHLFNT